jgi:hypothetical protein
MVTTRQAADDNYDYQLGKVAGIWAAQQGLDLDADTLEKQMNVTSLQLPLS